MKYAEIGLHVIPLCSHNHAGMSEKHCNNCQNPGKVPLISNWTKKASNDSETVAAWFDKYRTANIGILTGSAGRIVAIDVDGDYGFERLRELSGGGIPATWEFATPGGGYRYLFRAPEGVKLHKYTDALPGDGHQEISILADGQQTVMPPSRHRSGGTYEFAPGRSLWDIEIADAPDWLVGLLSPAFAAERLFKGGDQAEGALASSSAGGTDSEARSSRSELSEVKATPSPLPSGDRQDSYILKTLRDKCQKIRDACNLQYGAGCDEPTWFHICSLLTSAGAVGDAMSFSQRSLKHDERSRERIAGMTAEAHGPPRCTTLGCGVEQIERCFGKLKDGESGEIVNSPAAFLKGVTAATADIAETVARHTDYRVQYGKLGELAVKNESETFTKYANFVAYPTEDVVLDDGVGKERCFVLECVLLESGERLPPIRVEQSDFHDPTKWVYEWGLAPSIYPTYLAKDKVRHAAQQLAGAAKRVTVYTHLGFRKIADKWRYLHAGGCSCGGDVQVEVDKRLGKYLLPEKTADPAASVRQSLSLLKLAAERITLPLLALMFLAPLCELLRLLGIEPSFVAWLYGQTGTRKSSLVALFMCHFGRFTAKSPPGSFRDTANSLEKRAFSCKDSVLWIDDFHPSQSPQDAKKMEQTAQSLLRIFGDRTGRGRLGPDASSRPDYEPRGVALVTGEQFPDGHSSQARLSAIELLPSDIDLGALTEAQGKASLLAESMLGYVNWVGKQMSEPSFAEAIRRRFEERRALALPSQSHGRLAETAAWLYLGLECLLDYADAVGAVGPDERDARLQSGWSTLLSLTDVQSEQVREAAPTFQFLSIVSALLQNGSIYVWKADGSDRELYDGMTRRGDHVGWSDDEHYFFMPDILYNEVSAFLSRQNQHIPLKPSALWKQLDAEGALTPEVYLDNGKTKTKRVRRKSINKIRENTIWIKSEFITLPDDDLVERNQARRTAASASERGSARPWEGE